MIISVESPSSLRERQDTHHYLHLSQIRKQRLRRLGDMPSSRMIQRQSQAGIWSSTLLCFHEAKVLGGVGG